MTFFGVVWTYIMTLGLGQIVILTLGLKVYTLLLSSERSTKWEEIIEISHIFVSNTKF